MGARPVYVTMMKGLRLGNLIKKRGLFEFVVLEVGVDGLHPLVTFMGEES